MPDQHQRTRIANHVVMFSGGIGSWATAKRVAERHGTDRLTLLFADTLVEDDDLYRFLTEAADNVGGELVKIADGRTPFEVFHDDRFLGNARLANCSKYLKQVPCQEWIEERYEPTKVTLYVGIDWTEEHRLPAVNAGWDPYRVEAPLTDKPYLTKNQMLDMLRDEGIDPPDAYGEGFPHNNCLMQGCVRGGQAYWHNLLRERPEVYADTEQREQKLREYLDADVAMLRDRTGGTTDPLTLREFRERLERQPSMFDEFEWGGCGCFVEAADG